MRNQADVCGGGGDDDGDNDDQDQVNSGSQ